MTGTEDVLAFNISKGLASTHVFTCLRPSSCSIFKASSSSFSVSSERFLTPTLISWATEGFFSFCEKDH